MFAYRRKRSLGCEQLEGRFAPSSVLVGAGGRSTFKDAQALETAQAEQAAAYLAASAVLSQSSSVANVAPITFDQPAAGEVESKGAWDGSGFCGVGQDGFVGYCVVEPIGTPILYWWIDIGGDETPQPADDGTESDGQNTEDPDFTPDIPSVDPVSPETPSEPSNDADPVGAVPSEELPAGGDDVAAEDFPPVVDDTLVAGDEVADPVGEDTGIPDPSNTEEMPRCGNDFENLGPIYPVGEDTEFTDVTGSDEIALDEVPVEPQFEDAADEVAAVDA
jgi:hypothetical protein